MGYFMNMMILAVYNNIYVRYFDYSRTIAGLLFKKQAKEKGDDPIVSLRQSVCGQFDLSKARIALHSAILR